MRKIGRREFFKKSAGFGMAAAVSGSFFKQSGWVFSEESLPDICVGIGDDAHLSAKKAVEAIGGMKKFVTAGSKVAILPNAQRWHPGTFTKPGIVQSVIEMCRQAGAEEVACLSWLDQKNWEATGLQSAIEEAGGKLILISREEANFKPVPVQSGKNLQEVMIMKEFYNYDVFIDMPITKDHAGNKFTGTLKNLMGLNFPTNNRLFHKPDWTTDRNAIEFLDQCIVELNTVIKPHLCIVDATEFIITNGPMGPGEILTPKKVIAGTDRIAIDAYCCTLWGLKPADIFMIQKGFDKGLGEIDLNKIKLKEIKI